jgi:hypothetical protein
MFSTWLVTPREHLMQMLMKTIREILQIRGRYSAREGFPVGDTSIHIEAFSH